MAGAQQTKFEWRGNDIVAAVHRAAARGVVALGETIVSEAKQRVHRLTGTLSRSIHSAPDNYQGGSDYDDARDPEHGGSGRDLAAGAVIGELPTWVTESQAVVLVGSWIPYACVEEGRHPYMQPAIEAAMGRALGVFQQAFREEGLA